MPRRRLSAAHAFRPLGRRSGRIPAEPYPPPRCRQDNRSLLRFPSFHCRDTRTWVITTLSCLIPLAGFEVSLIGRFSGVPRGGDRTIQRRNPSTVRDKQRKRPAGTVK